MGETTNLMSIGQFSRLSRLSVRMLRHYDATGVLVPADSDPWTGYRRYAPHQLKDAADVRDLRDSGFGVAAIGALLTVRDTPAWINALEVQRESLVAEVDAARARLSLIDRLLHQGEPHMSITINRKTIPAMTVVSLRGTVPTYADEGLLWERMMPLLSAKNIEAVGPCGVIEHDDQYTEENVDLSIFLPVEPGTRVEEPLEIVELPERDCMVAHVQGPCSQFVEAHDLIGGRMASENLAPRNDGTIASHAFNLYIATIDEVSEEELVSEVYQPLR